MIRRFFFSLPLMMAVAACGAEPEQAPVTQGDPALAAALGDQIMVDPDLVGQNAANAVAHVPDGDASVPALDTTIEAIERARAEALAMVGGAQALLHAPAAQENAANLPAGATSIPAAKADCANRAAYTAAWAAKMPAAFPVYPRGAVQDAAGTDDQGCALRVVNFQTPVPLGEVMDFYYTRATAAGFGARRLMQDGDDVLAGTKGKAAFVLYARRMASGATEVDLVTSGG